MKVPSDNGVDTLPEPMPTAGPEMGVQQDMAQDFGNDMEDIPAENVDGKSDSEIDDIFSRLNTEKQAAVIKYAKSMVSDGGDGMPDEDDMVTEITNNVLDDMNTEPEKGEDKKIRNNKVTASNPFVAKGFGRRLCK